METIIGVVFIVEEEVVAVAIIGNLSIFEQKAN